MLALAERLPLTIRYGDPVGVVPSVAAAAGADAVHVAAETTPFGRRRDAAVGGLVRLAGQRFDPDGAYVRRWVPELAHLAGAAAHEPWKSDVGYSGGYPLRIVDHAEERREALERHRAARA